MSQDQKHESNAKERIAPPFVVSCSMPEPAIKKKKNEPVQLTERQQLALAMKESQDAAGLSSSDDEPTSTTRGKKEGPPGTKPTESNYEEMAPIPQPKKRPNESIENKRARILYQTRRRYVFLFFRIPN